MNERLLQGDLFAMRRVLARTGAFEGYRAAPVALSGGLALLAGLLQRWIDPSPFGFVVLWLSAAAVGFGLNFVTAARTYGTSPRQWERSLAVAALLDLTPALLGGALLTSALVARHEIELLPGVWMVLFATGVIASRRHVPRPCAFVGVAYLIAGAATLFLLPGDRALRPQVMAGTFGLGQCALAWVLMRNAGGGETP